jgi:aspartate racemase
MRHIGILQYSLEGAQLCYREIVEQAMGRLGAHHHPVITMTGLSMHETIAAWDAKDFTFVASHTAKVVDRLAAAGADFFVMPDNTAHMALERLQQPLALPGLHIAEVVMAEAKRRGFRRLGITGTAWTMQGNVYPDACARYGLDWQVPDAATQVELHRIIMDELCMGQFLERSIARFVEATQELRAGGCDAVVLGCTEIPLILSDSNSALPVLDTTRLLATAAVDVALSDHPLPDWQGGKPSAMTS